MEYNKKQKNMQIKFGVPYFDIYDPRFSNFGVPVAVRGSISFKVKSHKKFLRQYGKDSESMEEFQARLRNAVVRYVKECIVSIPDKYGLPVMQIKRKLDKIGSMLQSKLKSRVKKDFFITLSAVDIATIEVDKTSDGYLQLKKVTEDVESATVLAQAELSIQKMQEEQRIEMADYEAEVQQKRAGVKKKALIGGIVLGAAIVIGAIVAIVLLGKK
jgi:hypothetical protein